MWKPPKVVGEGAKGIWDQGSKGLSRVLCTLRTLSCTSALSQAPWFCKPKVQNGDRKLKLDTAEESPIGQS